MQARIHIDGMIDAMLNGKNDEAAVHYAALKKTGDVIDLLEVAETLLEYGLAPDAIGVLEAIEGDEHKTEVTLTLAEAYITDDRDEEAIRLLEDVDPTDSLDRLRVLVMLADLYQAQGLDEVALKKLEEALALDPNESILLFGLAELHSAMGAFEQAIPLYMRLEKAEDAEQFDFAAQFAEALTMIGEFEEALVKYEQAVRKQPSLNTVFGYAMTAQQIGRHELAVKEFERLRSMDPDFTSLYVPYAETLEAMGRVDEALAMVDQGIERDEYNEELRITKSMLYMKRRQVAEAVEALREALALNPESLNATELLLSVLMDEEDYENVIDTAEALEEFTTSPLMTWFKAKAAYELERYEDAVEFYTIIADNYKQDVSFALEWSNLLNEEGRRAEARSVLEATRLHAEDPLDRQALEERLESLNDL